jgi:putative drug exporter of the RND superfamily
VSTLASSILIVLVFGAASDYALLLTHRYRAELRHHATCEDAMAATLRATLPTLAASAATVIGAMLCLLAAESASLHGLGPVGAVSIAAALLAQATFLPALLLVAGRRAFWPRVPRPGDTGGEGSRAWSAISGRIARGPALAAICGVLVLGAACSGLLALRIDNNPVANLKNTAPSVIAANLLTAHFGPGVLDPVVLLAPPREAATAASLARAMPDVASVTAQAPIGGYAAYSATLGIDPYGTQAATAVRNLRSQLDKAAPGSLVGGNPAISYDFTQEAARDARLLIPLVLAVILVVVAILLRAIVAPLLLVAATALSFAASFGLSSLLWRHALGYSGIEAPIPLYIFIFLVALGVDYGIFLTARIREEARKSGATQGILRGLGVTGGVITAAGIVLAGTFLALTQNPQVSIDEVGTAVAIGVLLDTLLVRTVVVPATFLTLREAIWWPTKRNKSTPAGDTADRAPADRHAQGHHKR